MKILGRSRTWFAVAAAWAALVDLLVIVHDASDRPLATALWLAVPVAGALAALVTMRSWVAWVGTAAYAVLALLAIFSVGIFLGPGVLAMAMGSLLVGVSVPGE